MPFKNRTFYRVFPTEKLDFELIKIDTNCNKIYIRHLQELSKNNLKKEASYWEFKTNGVFFNATQEKVYTEVKADLLNNVVKGCNGVIIAFGQTGTGKTFTTSGLHFSEEEFGMAPRIASDLLDIKRNQPSNMKMCLQMSYVEFNNASVVDLLNDLPNSVESYKCREVRKVKVSTEYDALRCLFLGEGRKHFVENNSQYLSNVSTTVVTFHITSKNMDLTNPTKICSRVHVVDLAGNDSCANMSALHKNPKEVGSANVTKSQLEQFILCLVGNIPENIRVQQRMNALIYYLDGDFSCENILRFVGHIRARSEDLLVTLSMLRFGHVVQGLKPKKKQIKFDVNEEVELEYVRKKLDSLDKEKHLNSILLNTDLVSGLNQPRIAHLGNLIQNYLKDDIGEITVMNVADTQMVLKRMKEICTNCQNEVKKLQAENQLLTAQHQSEISLKHRGSKLSSQGSSSKISRKSSSKIRSKESIIKEKKTSVSTMSEKRITSDDQGTSVDLSYTKRKKPRSATTSGQKPSGSKKKSSSTSVNKQESKSSISIPDPSFPIPDLVPEKKEVWKNFASQSVYKDKVEEYKLNEKDVRSSFVTYVKEVKKLQACKEAVNKCSNDLIMAQTFRKFNIDKDEYDDQGFLVISYAEKQCKDILDDAQITLVEQQEKVLRWQEELKVNLENRRAIIRKIDEEFDQYSKEHYKVTSLTSQEIEDDLKEITFAVNLERPEESLEEIEEIVQVPGVPEKTQIVRKLQKLMAQEIQKRNRIVNEKRHKWKNK